MLKMCKKANILLNIYPHNTLHSNLRYIAQSYALLYILIMRLRLVIYICLHDTFLELTNS